MQANKGFASPQSNLATSQVLGTSADCTVSVIVCQNAGIVIKVRKDRLRSFKSVHESLTTESD